MGIPMDAGGLVVDALAERLEAGARPKLLYVIPEYQNPSGWTLALERREPLIELCRRHGVLIVEDVAYREMAFDDDTALPSLWSLGPDIVLQAGTFSKIFCPGVRLGWAAGPGRGRRAARGGEAADRPVRRRARPADGRGVRPRRALRPPAPARPRALRGALARAVGGARARARRRLHVERADRRLLHLAHAPRRAPTRSRCAKPRSRRASRSCRARRSTPARAAHSELRLSFSHLGAGEYDEAVRRLAGVIRSA